MWSIASSSNEIRYRVTSCSFLGGLLRPHLTLPRIRAQLETDKPPKSHRAAAGLGSLLQGPIPSTRAAEHLDSRSALAGAPHHERAGVRTYFGSVPPALFAQLSHLCDSGVRSVAQAMGAAPDASLCCARAVVIGTDPQWSQRCDRCARASCGALRGCSQERSQTIRSSAISFAPAAAARWRSRDSSWPRC